MPNYSDAVQGDYDYPWSLNNYYTPITTTTSNTIPPTYTYYSSHSVPQHVPQQLPLSYDVATLPEESEPDLSAILTRTKDLQADLQGMYDDVEPYLTDKDEKLRSCMSNAIGDLESVVKELEKVTKGESK